MSENREDSAITFDGDAEAARLGMNERQHAMAEGLRRGLTQAAAYTRAGYPIGASEAATRSAAHGRANSRRVQLYLQAARRSAPAEQTPEDLLRTIASLVALLERQITTTRVSRRTTYVT